MIRKNITKYRYITVVVILFINCKLCSQSYFASKLSNGFYKVHFESTICSCDNCCELDFIAPTLGFADGIAMDSLENVLAIGIVSDIYKIDTTTGLYSAYFDIPGPALNIQGFASNGGSIFYIMMTPEIANTVYRINVITGTMIDLGESPYPNWGDITSFNGNYYYITRLPGSPFIEALVRLDITNPANSTVVVEFTGVHYFVGLTASQVCNSFLAIDQLNNQLVLINIIDGSIIPLCDVPDFFFYITSTREFYAIPDCGLILDLDCNDSSGATDADYNADEIDCLDNESAITDSDISMQYDAIIQAMTIEVAGFIPDAPFEILTFSGNVPNIDLTGDGTDMITFSNAGGAKSTDFKDALRLIRYQNNALSPTAGTRTIEVQFTTESGSESNVATAFIEVVELPLVQVDVGDDIQICEGASTTFNAGNPGAEYEWSTGDDTQTITVDESGEYSVTVADGVNCPGSDTVQLQVLPIIEVSLSGDTEICDNQPATIIINTSTPFSLDITINSDPGSPFNLPNVTGTTSFNDLISDQTTYTITSVIPSQEACITTTNPELIIDVYPSYIDAFDVSICDGDSVWLGFYWETEAGVYDNAFQTFAGCDSIVTTTITVVPAIQINAQGTTCDSSQVGIFITNIDNPSGCDTIVTTTVALLPSDTTSIAATTCIQAETGITINTLTNISGCDSLIITTTAYTQPSDTTFLFQTSCDSASWGVIYYALTGSDGCDSLIITTTSISPSDTTYLSGISCDSASIDISQTLYNNSMGCDSLVITTIVAGVPDTTYLFSTSCDSTSLGVMYYALTGTDGCDSLVISTVTYSASDSTFISRSSCDPADVGVFIQSYINRFGCDSIVTETVSLLPSDAIAINSTTCDPAETGVFTNVLINQYGCDSIVTEIVTLLPSDATFLTGTTCKLSEAGIFITTHLNQYGCDSIVTLTVALIPSDTTLLSFGTCDSSGWGVLQYTLPGVDGCDSLIVETTSLFPLPQLELIVTSDFNGYGISCFGAHDGRIQADASGEDPFDYFWSTGDTTQTIAELGAGDYSISITDVNGCTIANAVSLDEPGEFTIGFEVSQPDCFTNNSGNITVLQSGGVMPVQYSKDGVNYQSSPTFSSLAAGSYTITALDANDCETKEIIMINVSVDVNVDLGDDQLIMPGDTSTIEALVNVPYDSLVSITWTGLTNSNCPTCLTQMVAPIITTAYTVSVSNAQGCSDLDTMYIFVQRNIDIYIPNVFSPNGDGINDRLLISAGADVEEIESFTIFDRWGNMVFLNEHFLPNDPSEAWDGKRKGVTVNPGVFAFKMIARFTDGNTISKFGDITLLR